MYASFDPGTRHMAFCVVEEAHAVPIVKEFCLYDVGPKLTSLKACDALIENVLKPRRWSILDAVIIEAQQPQNIKAQLIAQTVRTWMAACGVQKIVTVPAALKSKSFKCKNAAGLKGRAYKKLSVTEADRLLGTDWTVSEEWLKYYRDAKKKDDLADAINQLNAWLVGKK